MRGGRETHGAPVRLTQEPPDQGRLAGTGRTAQSDDPLGVGREGVERVQGLLLIGGEVKHRPLLDRLQRAAQGVSQVPEGGQRQHLGNLIDLGASEAALQDLQDPQRRLPRGVLFWTLRIGALAFALDAAQPRTVILHRRQQFQSLHAVKPGSVHGFQDLRATAPRRAAPAVVPSAGNPVALGGIGHARGAFLLRQRSTEPVGVVLEDDLLVLDLLRMGQNQASGVLQRFQQPLLPVLQRRLVGHQRRDLPAEQTAGFGSVPAGDQSIARPVLRVGEPHGQNRLDEA
ncbi:MAG: hypothetical protein MZV64_10315 [Ignavibacteriales bacterium]|nr:hypothetical protein [Ignavibacteriales bacterium]